MIRCEPFEVTKDVFDRAKAESPDKTKSCYYMANSDINELFPEYLRCGYGLYSVMVSEQNGKYICNYCRGNSCD